MAAPSLVMVMSPRLSMSILSMPRGPRVVLRTSPMTRAAMMLFLWASLPRFRVVPSLRMRTGCPDPVVVKYAISLTSFSRCRMLFSRKYAKIKLAYKL